MAVPLIGKLTYLILVGASKDLLVLAFPKELKLFRPYIVLTSSLEVLEVAPP